MYCIYKNHEHDLKISTLPVESFSQVGSKDCQSEKIKIKLHFILKQVVSKLEKLAFPFLS